MFLIPTNTISSCALLTTIRDGKSMKDKRAFANCAANIFPWKKWKPTISRHGLKVVVRLPPIAKCCVGRATAVNLTNDRLHLMIGTSAAKWRFLPGIRRRDTHESVPPCRGNERLMPGRMGGVDQRNGREIGRRTGAYRHQDGKPPRCFFKTIALVSRPTPCVRPFLCRRPPNAHPMISQSPAHLQALPLPARLFSCLSFLFLPPIRGISLVSPTVPLSLGCHRPFFLTIGPVAPRLSSRRHVSYGSPWNAANFRIEIGTSRRM